MNQGPNLMNVRYVQNYLLPHQFEPPIENKRFKSVIQIELVVSSSNSLKQNLK